MDYTFNWHEIPKYFVYYENGLKIGIILKGVIYTIKISIIILILSLFFGSLGGIVMSISKGFLKEFFLVAVNFFRNTPPIIVMFIFYFFLGNTLSKYLKLEMLYSSPFLSYLISMVIAPEQLLVPFISASIGLSLYEGSYISEIIRGGINGVSKDQIDAGISLGFSKFEVYIHIVIPQAFEKTIPALLGQFVSIIKNTAIASVVAIPELTFQSMEVLASSRMIIEIWVIIMTLYFLINISISKMIKRLEIKVKQKYS